MRKFRSLAPKPAASPPIVKSVETMTTFINYRDPSRRLTPPHHDRAKCKLICDMSEEEFMAAWNKLASKKKDD